MTLKKRTVLLLLILLLALLAACGQAQELQVDFYDMGKADAMLVTTPDGARILIDTGTNKGGKALVDRFEREKIGPIDVMIITHYDKDHVGGADKIIEDIGVKEVYMPVYAKESKQYEQFVEALEEGGVIQHPLGTKESVQVPLDGVTMTISAAHETYYGRDEENDFSLCVRMTYGDTRFLFPGDAEAPRQYELIEEGNIACDVLKVPYHGRMTAASRKFLTEAAPKIAFVPDGPEDPASDELVGILEEMGAAVYLGREGGVTVLSDGKTVKVK